MTRASKIQKEEMISYIRTRVYSGQAFRWHGMSDTFRHGNKQIIYV